MGQRLYRAGLKRGERIPFLLDDTPAYPAAFFGAVRAGFVPMLLNIQTTPDVLNFFLKDTGRISLYARRRSPVSSVRRRSGAARLSAS